MKDTMDKEEEQLVKRIVEEVLFRFKAYTQKAPGTDNKSISNKLLFLLPSFSARLPFSLGLSLDAAQFSSSSTVVYSPDISLEWLKQNIPPSLIDKTQWCVVKGQHANPADDLNLNREISEAYACIIVEPPFWVLRELLESKDESFFTAVPISLTMKGVPVLIVTEYHLQGKFESGRGGEGKRATVHYINSYRRYLGKLSSLGFTVVSPQNLRDALLPKSRGAKELITAEDIKALSGKSSTLIVTDHTIITPQAWDEAKRYGISIVHSKKEDMG
ncbi:MAG: hypothetical protein QW728_04790 [Thermoplasmata archaeon]